MPTIKDVAERAGVSTATVSYVLNGTGAVTEATRRRVLAAVSELNYQPNYAARSLRSRSRTLGLVLPALSHRLADPLLVDLLAGLSTAAMHGYYLLLAPADNEPEHLQAELLVRTGRVDGVVLLDVRSDDERAQYLARQAIPFVCAGVLPSGVDAPFAGVDGRQGAQTAVQHLLGLGHRRIGLILLPSDLAESEPRFEGYAAALAAGGVTLNPTLAVEAGRSEDDGFAAMQELLSRPAPPTAVLACSDELAFGAMHALRDAGLEVGRDVSLVGFDDVPMAAHTHPPLTTLRASRRLIGEHLARLLIELIEGRLHMPRSIVCSMQLMVRKSTAPPPAVSAGSEYEPE